MSASDRSVRAEVGMSIAALLACVGGRLPDVLPGIVADKLPAVYLSPDYDVFCASCANVDEIRPSIVAVDVADAGDRCSCCGCAFGVEVCHG